MSYCRFQNTSNDLKDCIEAINNMQEQEVKPKEALSKEEYRAFIRLLQQAEDLMYLTEDMDSL